MKNGFFAYSTFVLALCCLSSLQAQQPAVNNSDVLRGLGSFERGYTATCVWGGVDSSEYLRGLQETAPIVLPNGQVQDVSIPVSVAVADLNGDKLLDLIVADPTGLIWFFPNSGTPTEPKFTSGEIIPVWLRSYVEGVAGENEQRSVACNKIFITDFNDDGKPDLILGTFMGEIFFIPNLGTATTPRFGTATQLKDMSVPTRSDGKLWGTFFSPLYADFTKTGRRDLILGEGTYSANNIYYFPNAGSSATPRFSEKTRQILIPGMGREHLTPQMVDWNNDGIPDIITGERDGTVTVFLCKSNNPKKFEFDPNPITVKFGSSLKLGSLSNPVPVDLNGDGLFDLVVGRTNGRVAVAYNKGKAGEPQFDMPVEIKGVQNYPKYLSPTGWTLNAPPQSTYHIFHLVTGQDPEKLTGAEKDRAALAYEAGFSPPPDSTGKYSAKLEFLPVKSKIFTTPMPLPPESVFKIACDSTGSLKPDTDYEIQFAVKGSGWTNTQFVLDGRQEMVITDPKTNEKRFKTVNYGKKEDFSVGGSWSTIIKAFRYSKAKEADPKDKSTPIDFKFSFNLTGAGTFYLDDVTVIEKK